MLKDILEDQGHEVVVFSSPEDAENMDSAVHPDLFLLDLMLPRWDGIELARSLRSKSYPTVPMIAMSASGRMLQTAIDSRLFQETLSKPFDLTTLLAFVERYAG